MYPSMIAVSEVFASWKLFGLFFFFNFELDLNLAFASQIGFFSFLSIPKDFFPNLDLTLDATSFLQLNSHLS